MHLGVLRGLGRIGKGASATYITLNELETHNYV